MKISKDRMQQVFFWVWVALALLLLGSCLLRPAEAQTRNCAPRDVVLARLADGHGEVRQSLMGKTIKEPSAMCLGYVA